MTQASKACDSCGAELVSGGAFCGQCGKAVPGFLCAEAMVPVVATAFVDPDPRRVSDQVASLVHGAVASGAAAVTALQCPRCGSFQFYGRRRITTFGCLLWGAGVALALLSIPLLFLFGLGFLTMLLALLITIVGVSLKQDVNICARCKQSF